MTRLRERLRPGDVVLLALLAIACALAAARSPGHPEIRGPLLGHLALLAGFAAVLVLSIAGRLPWSGLTRIVASLGLMFALYASLGRLGFLLHDGASDAALARIDAWIFGVDPALWLDGRVGHGLVEAMSFVYLYYLGWVYLSLAFECLGREEEDREAFLLGLTLTYAIAYVGYLVLPAHGPAGHHAERFAHALPGGPIYERMRAAVEANGGAIGAFPSLHVGGAFFLCAFSLRRNRMRGLTYLPVVPLVALSTVVLRWHWVVDWLGGIAVACLALAITDPILAWWRGGRAHAAAGAPAAAPEG